jgi:hypothetical protein
MDILTAERERDVKLLVPNDHISLQIEAMENSTTAPWRE